MHLSEQVGTYYVMQHKATLLSFVPTDILWEAIRDYRMDQEAKQKNETNGGKGEKRSNSVVASSGDDWDAKRQRTGTDAEDAEAVGGEVRMTGDEKAVDGEDAEAVADAVAVDGEGREKDEPPVMVGDAKDADDNDRKRHDTLSLVLCLAGGSMRSSRPIRYSKVWPYVEDTKSRSKVSESEEDLANSGYASPSCFSLCWFAWKADCSASVRQYLWSGRRVAAR